MQRPNREVLSFRSCVHARGDCQVEMSLKRRPPGFPFSLLAWGGSPFSLGILPLLPGCYPALASFTGNIIIARPAAQQAGVGGQKVVGGRLVAPRASSLRKLERAWRGRGVSRPEAGSLTKSCLLYTSDAADE